MLEKPYHILIIDDDEGMCEFLESVVEAEYGQDIKITVSSSSKDAIRLVETDRYNIILTDLNMPRFSGYNIVKQAHERNKSIQVIFLTGDLQISVAMTCFRDGAAALLTKPMEPAKLINAMNLCVKRLDIWYDVLNK